MMKAGREAAVAAGYTAAATLPAGNPRPSPMRWPRVGIYHVDGERSFHLKVSPVMRALRRSRAWPLLIRVTGRHGDS